MLKYIRTWLPDFASQVEALKKTKKKLYIIAISRKMPRIFDWIRLHESDDFASLGISINSILSGCEYTTEHAIPFIFRPNQHVDCNIIVVDDSAVMGNTMRRVTADIEHYTHGLKPSVSVIVAADTVNRSLISSDDIRFPNTVSESEIAHWLKFVSGCITGAELPIDVEFPIFHIDNIDPQSIRTKADSSKLPNYQVISNGVGNVSTKSFNILLDQDLMQVVNLDFSKARWFLKDTSAKLTLFSPFSISIADLTDEALFMSQPFKTIWYKILECTPYDDHDEISAERLCNSIAVMANYFNSIITFNRNRDNLVPEGVSLSGDNLDITDLKLLIGSDLANIIFPLIKECVDNCVTENYIWQKVELNDMIVHSDFKNIYDAYRKLAAASHIEDKDFSNILVEIFSASRYDATHISGADSTFHKMYSGIFETYSSLHSLMTTYFDKDETWQSINKWMDRKIDQGEIIPKYRYVKAPSGMIYWKRFFMCAYSAYEL